MNHILSAACLSSLFVDEELTPNLSPRPPPPLSSHDIRLHYPLPLAGNDWRYNMPPKNLYNPKPKGSKQGGANDQQELSQLREQNEALQEASEALQEANEALQEANEALQEENGKLQSAKSAFDADLEAMKIQRDTATSEASRDKAALGKAKEENDGKLQSAKSAFDADLEKMKGQLDTAISEASKFKDALDKVTAELAVASAGASTRDLRRDFFDEEPILTPILQHYLSCYFVPIINFLDPPRKRSFDGDKVIHFKVKPEGKFVLEQESAHNRQSLSSQFLRYRFRRWELFQKVEYILGQHGKEPKFLYHTTTKERIENALQSAATFTWHDEHGVSFEMSTPQGVIGAMSKGFLSTATTVLSAGSHAHHKVVTNEAWMTSIKTNNTIIMVVIPPSITQFLGLKGRLIPYHNDTYVKIEAACFPLQDMRNVSNEISLDDLAKLIKPGRALVFAVSCSWDNEKKHLK